MICDSPSLDRSERGATAVEYALIAGLIGLGIVGSLVTTRTSLSNTLGGVAGQMGSGASADSPAAALLASRTAYWSGKSQTGAPVISTANGSTTASFRFSDGSTVTFISGGLGTYSNYIRIVDRTAQVDITGYYDGSDQVAVFGVNHFVPNASFGGGLQPTTSESSNAIVDGTVTRSTVYTYNATGSAVAAPTGAPSADMLAAVQRTAADYAYFKGLMP